MGCGGLGKKIINFPTYFLNSYIGVKLSKSSSHVPKLRYNNQFREGLKKLLPLKCRESHTIWLLLKCCKSQALYLRKKYRKKNN